MIVKVDITTHCAGDYPRKRSTRFQVDESKPRLFVRVVQYVKSIIRDHLMKEGLL